MSRFAEQALAWYGRHGRELPWRGGRAPYEILVSEVMLQQTQVARVIPRYAAFLARFPTAAGLAAAPAADVIVEWSGLGYNRRALALHRAASVVAEHGWPPNVAALEALPGVGPYTAAAVASFAWEEPLPAVDTNARRVIERHDGVRRAPSALGRRAQELISTRRPAAFNHALMDLGATVCTARRPRCSECPLLECRSRGRVEPAPRRPSGLPVRPRFEDTDRYARGRILAALAAGRALPSELEGLRRERALAGLARDGRVVRTEAGARLP